MWPFGRKKRARQADFELILLQTGMKLRAASAKLASDPHDVAAALEFLMAMGACVATIRKHSLPYPIQEEGWAMRLLRADIGTPEADHVREMIGGVLRTCTSERHIKLVMATCLAPEYAATMERSYKDGFRLV